jgi:hypothetical protein
MRRLALLSVVAFVLLLAPAALGSPLLRLVPQQEGRANFGFTYRLFDTSDPLWGDTRPFAERIQDSITNELAGKTPTLIKVWTPWVRFRPRRRSDLSSRESSCDTRHCPYARIRV